MNPDLAFRVHVLCQTPVWLGPFFGKWGGRMWEMRH